MIEDLIFGDDFGTEYSLGAGGYAAANAYGMAVLVFEQYLHIIQPTTATLSVVDEITLPADAEIDSAVFGLTAEPAGLATVVSVAEVRSATKRSSSATSAVVVDFGRMVTVAGVSFPSSIAVISRWGGDAFHTIPAVSSGYFAEQQTDRLLVEFTGSVSASAFRDDADVELPAIPTGLELLVDGTTVWSERQGSSAGLEVPAASGGVSYAVDRTDAIREAFARRVGGPVRVELRANTPGLLTLQPVLNHGRVHTVAFPDGPSKALDLSAEGLFAVDLPLPGSSASWSVDQVRMIVRGGAGDDRVQPAEGPPLATEDAELVLAPARVLLARIPSTLLSRFVTLGGVRLPLARTGELGGRLLADDGGKPGTPVDGGDLTATRVEQVAAPAWTTLMLPAPLPLDGSALWLELQVSYGELEWALTPNGPTDPAAPGAELFRRLPGGGVRSFPVIEEIGALHGAIRLVGRADPNRPIAVLALDAGSGAPLLVTPGGVDVAGVIGLQTPVTPSGAVLTVDGLATAPGRVVFDQVQVRYRESV